MGQRDQDYSGIVELDDAYFSVPRPNRKRGQGNGENQCIAVVSLAQQGKFIQEFLRYLSNASCQGGSLSNPIKSNFFLLSLEFNGLAA